MGPFITSVTPCVWTAGNTYNIIITGENFGPMRWFDGIWGTDQNCAICISTWDTNMTPLATVSTYTVVSSTEIMATVTPFANDPTVTALLSFENLDFSDTWDYNIQIEACTPQINSISPRTWFAGKSYPIVIKGSCFITPDNPFGRPPTTLTTAISSGSGSTSLADVSIVSETEIHATATPDASATTGVTALIVSDPTTGRMTANKAQRLGNQIQWSNATTPNKVISTSDGSPPPVQNAVVGQQIALTTTMPTTTYYDGPTIPQPWTVGGTNIGGYAPTTASASVTPTTLNQPSLTTYFVYKGDVIPVTFQYCANIKGADPVYQCSLPANAAFTVDAPTGGSIGIAAVGTVDIQQMSGNPYLQFGTIYATNPGVLFSPAATAPAGSTNNFTWAQLLSIDTQSFNSVPCTFLPDAGPDLDNEYPAPTVQGTNNFGDAPATRLLPSDTTVTRTFSAQTYLLWNSGLSGAIPVPIGSVAWSFSGQATNSGTALNPAWTASGAGGAGSFKPAAASQPNYGYPSWPNHTQNGTCYPTN